jgi:hypothetical protein
MADFPRSTPIAQAAARIGYDGAVLLLDERITADGSHVRTWATCDGQRLQLHGDDGAAGELSLVAVDRVMRRYGRPLEHGIALEGEPLACGSYRLRRLRYHAVVDTEGRDYLVWEAPDSEPLACMAAMATAALRYLALRLAAERPSGN